MSDQQTIIDALIDHIDKAILKGSVTNVEVAAVLDFLNEAQKGALHKNVSEIISELFAFLKGLSWGAYKKDIPGCGGALNIYPDGSSEIEADFLKIRKRATFKETLIEKLSHVGGELAVSPARMLCNKVDEYDSFYRCYFDKGDNNEVFNEFVVNDQARCRVFFGSGAKYYWRLVTAVGIDYIDLSKTDCDAGSDIPGSGDTICQLGNRTDVSRQSAQVFSSYGDDAPSYKQYAGINNYSLVDKELIQFTKHGNQIKADLFLPSGESVATLFNIQQGLIYSEVSAIRKETNENSNLLQNGSFTNSTLYWITVSNIKLFTVAGKLLSFNNNFYGDQNRLIEISKDGSIYNIHLKNIAIKQYNSYIAKPEKVLLADGTYANPTCIISFRYKCISAGSLKVGFEGTPLYFEQSLSVTEEYTQLELTGTWDLTGDFLLSFDGEIMLYDLALRNDKMEDFQVFTNSKITQTSESISAAVSRISNIENAESSWLTTAVGTKILASLVFNDTAKTPLQSLFEITAEYIKLKSSYIKLEGLVTANNNFIIHEDGRIETNEATINGSILTPFQEVDYSENSIIDLDSYSCISAEAYIGHPITLTLKTDLKYNGREIYIYNKGLTANSLPIDVVLSTGSTTTIALNTLAMFKAVLAYEKIKWIRVF